MTAYPYESVERDGDRERRTHTPMEKATVADAGRDRSHELLLAGPGVAAQHRNTRRHRPDIAIALQTRRRGRIH